MSSTDGLRVGFLGAGRMAQALSNGIITSGLVKAENVIASDLNAPILELTAKLGARTTHSNIEVAKNSDVIIIAVKPHVVEPVLKEIASSITEKHLVMSIAAGITIASLEAPLPSYTRVIRLMPNTPALVQAGATVYSLGSKAKPEDGELASKLFTAIGLCKCLPEKYLDAVSALSGAGPAYCFLAIEALADGGVKMGLPRDLAMELAAQTLLGSAKLQLETKQHPGQLKDAVCSPGGVTICGVHALEAGGFRSSLINAVEAATLKARSLDNPQSKI